MSFSVNCVRTAITLSLRYSKVEVPEISERYVWNTLSSLKKTATGPDQIPYWVWWDQAEIFTPIITRL